MTTLLFTEWRYHMLLVYNYVLLKMSTWCSKHVEENSILWINNNQCIKLVTNNSQFMMHGQKNIKLLRSVVWGFILQGHIGCVCISFLYCKVKIYWRTIMLIFFKVMELKTKDRKMEYHFWNWEVLRLLTNPALTQHKAYL